MVIAVFSAADPEKYSNDGGTRGISLITANVNELFWEGGLTLLGALNFALRYAKSKRPRRPSLSHHWPFFLVCRGSCFKFQDIWEAGWWFWHALRLAAYGIAFWLVLLTYRNFEDRTLRTQSELDTLFHTSIDGKRMIDMEFNQVLANETFAGMPGVKTASEKGLKCYDLFPRPICHSLSVP